MKHLIKLIRYKVTKIFFIIQNPYAIKIKPIKLDIRNKR